MGWERVGGRGAECFERGKYGEVSGYVGRRNKEENGLPTGISKRVLYKEFRRCGYIVDVFVSRKKRLKAEGPFAFIRFKFRGGALEAIKVLDGTSLETNTIRVTMSKFERNGTTRDTGYDGNIQGKKTKRVIQKWLEVKRKAINDDNEGKKQERTSGQEKMKRKKDYREALWEFVLSLLNIDLGKVMYLLLDEWNGPGNLEVRDVGTYRCLITFSSSEIRDAAFENQLLLSVFDELRPHWDIFWCHSRRVWIEIMGMPVCHWCPENFIQIAKIWGKPIRLDDRTEESKSYTIGRIQIDCYQWEMVHEWISVKIGDRTFDVFAKETSAEGYNVQSHPDRVDVYSYSGEEVTGEPTSEQAAPAESTQTPAAINDAFF
ncbi:hypothetical protein PIB30_046499 [Stylosanthes scabra]|uniref:RRM domain-containing protein n=1 Tax=Stylosanthes scabra TaxID=79078 RepID=A0ABU6WGG1_9FABA|nr:hypothetical protein [Stylosanthes scabra]